MLKFSNTTRKTALAALLGTGLVGSAAVMLTPVVAQAQQWHRDMDDRGFRADGDDRYRSGWDRDRYYGRDWDDNFRVGLGVYGYPGYYPYYSGYYDPYAYDYSYDYGTYCSSYDYYGNCAY